MKLTPLLLFLLILVVLVIAITTLKNPISPIEKEGFVQFKTNVVPQSETVVTSYSSRPIVKLYDNLFIDRQNLNIVEVVASEFIGNIDSSTYIVSRGNVDLTGTSISAINVQTRDGVRTNYQVTANTPQESTESKISSIASSYRTVPFYTSACTTTSKYQLFYIPWGTDTYIHGIKLTASPSDAGSSSFNPVNLFSYYIPSSKTANMSASYYPNSPINLTVPTSSDTSSFNGKQVTEPLYSTRRQVYQLSSDIKYDIKSGNVIVNSSNSIVVYDRSGKQTTYSTIPDDSVISTPMTDSASSAWLANNATNTTQIVYIPSSGKTVILLLQKDAAGRFVVINTSKFNKKNIIGSNGEGDNVNDLESTGLPSPPVPGNNIDPSAISDYYKWYWYWNSAGPGTNPQYSENYLLKTQIVPPVCPSCPTANCASTASTVNDKAKSSDSESKTSDSSDNIITTTVDSAGNTITKTVDSAGNVVTKTVDSAGNIINKTVDTAGNVINKSVDTASNLLTSGATGATNLLTSGASGATDLLKSGASGATDLLKSGASGATDLLKSGASGATDLLKSGVSGTAGLLRDAGSGIVGIAGKTLDTTGNVMGSLTSRNDANAIGGAGAYYGGMNTPYGSGSGSGYSAPGFSRGNPPIDNYSYYGAMPSKGSNYIPITADFSAFKK